SGSPSAQVLVGGQCQELVERVLFDHLGKQARGGREDPACQSDRADFAVNPVQLVSEEAVEPALRDESAIFCAGSVSDPLPQLRAADFRGRGVFHQVVKWHTAIATQPCLDVLLTDANAAAQS